MLEWPAGPTTEARKRISIPMSRRALFFWRAAAVAIHTRWAANPCRTWPMGRCAGHRGHTVTQGMHVRAIQFDPSAYLVSSADGSVTGDEDINVVRHALKQPQPNEVVLNRIRGVQVGERNHVRKHVAGDENAALLDQQRCMALGMRRMLDNPDLRAIPGICPVSAGRPVMRPNRSGGISSAISGGNPSATRAFQSAFDSRSRI